MNQQTNSLKDLEVIKKHEEEIKKYKEEKSPEIEITNYKHLAYKVRNPFKGI